jgi:hypothetical protein
LWYDHKREDLTFLGLFIRVGCTMVGLPSGHHITPLPNLFGRDALLEVVHRFSLDLRPLDRSLQPAEKKILWSVKISYKNEMY